MNAKKVIGWIAFGCWALLFAIQLLDFSGTILPPQLDKLLSYFPFLTYLITVVFFWISGTIRKTVFGILIWLPMALLVIGVPFKFMHWPFANEMMLLGGLGLALIYFIRFLLKQEKGVGDILRLIAVLQGGLGLPMAVWHLIPGWIVPVLNTTAWTAAILHYLLTYSEPPSSNSGFGTSEFSEDLHTHA